MKGSQWQTAIDVDMQISPLDRVNKTVVFDHIMFKDCSMQRGLMLQRSWWWWIYHFTATALFVLVTKMAVTLHYANRFELFFHW